jgi:phosphoenolpyruvate carboxykinase (GTP)
MRGVPQRLRKTNLAMLVPPASQKGWKVWTVGDASPGCGSAAAPVGGEPEADFFGVAPGTSEKTNPNALASLMKNSIFTNVALARTGPVVGGPERAAAGLIDWQGNLVDAG